MVVIDTSTTPLATAYVNQRKVDRRQNGVLWALQNGPTGGYIIAKLQFSTDNGATWTAADDLNQHEFQVSSNYTRNVSFFIDVDDYAHVVYKDNHYGYIYYRRGTPNAGRTAWTWSAATEVTSDTVCDYPDVIAHREGTGWKAHITLSYGSGATNYAVYKRVGITSGGVITNERTGNSLTDSIGGTYSNANHTWPSIDFNHTGDGKTVAGGTPHLYAAWSAGGTGAGKGIRFKKATYSAGPTWNWGTEREIDSTRYVGSADTWLNCLFDGTRVIIAGCLLEGVNYDLVLHERDAADTTTTTRVLIDNATTSEQMRLGGSATYDGDGNVYLSGTNLDESAGSRDLVYRKWTRSGASLGAEVVIDSGVGSTPNISVKRGFSGRRFEWIYTDGTASPYNVTFGSIDLNNRPTAPTLTALASASKGGPITFDWVHNDADGDPQSAYALVRKRVP